MKLRDALQIVVYGRGFFHGVLFGDWIRLLKENRFARTRSQWFVYSMITFSSVLNSAIHCWEVLRFRSGIRKAKINPPIFILGGWRSGTTLLHILFGKDERFAYPNYIQVMNPHTFLSAEWFYTKVVDAAAPETRGIDNMASGSRLPEEDEYALLLLTGMSYQLDGVFPRSSKQYKRFLTFRNATEDETFRWKDALQFFVRKLSYKYHRPLVLKSPAHTGRIRMILDVFPDAKFIYIHRNPFEVFQSYFQMLKKFATVFSVTDNSGEILTNHTFEVYKELNTAFFEERNLIPKGHYCEIGYEDLTQNPIGELRRIYQELDLPDFEVAEPEVSRYLASIADYKRNKLTDLSPELRSRIVNEWNRLFVEWGYSTEEAVSKPE